MMPATAASGAQTSKVTELDSTAIESGQRYGDDEHHGERQRDRGDAERYQHEKRDQRDERADHEHVAMREIDHADDAVDHGVADGDQAVDRTQRDAVDKLL